MKLKKPAFALLSTALGLGIALLGLELGLRFLLFSDSALARRLGAPWRKAERYADPHGEDAYWKLQHLFLDPTARSGVPGPDPVCGWIGWANLREQADPDPAKLRGRRPILLYGDSYARCTTSAVQCFPALLEQSDLRDRFVMINLGVGGYGVDQELLLLRTTIDRWKEFDPIVVVSFLVDDDFHRTTLTFRSWPKPRFSIVGGELVPSGPPMLPPDEFLAENPVGIRSYLARFVVQRQGLLPHAWRARFRERLGYRQEQIALGQKLLEELHRELTSRGLEHFFLSFHGWDSLQAHPVTRWADELVVETAARIGVPLIGTRPYLLAAAGDDLPGAGPRLFEINNGYFGHYNGLGNWVAFQAMRRGIEGRFGAEAPPDSVALLGRFLDDSGPDASARVLDTIYLGSPARALFLGKSAVARTSDVPYPPFPKVPTSEYVLLRPGEGGPTRLRITIPDGAVRFRGRAIVVARERTPESPPGALSLSVSVDGEAVLSTTPPIHPDSTPVDVEVEGRHTLELDASRTGAYDPREWIHIAEARFEWKR